MEREHDTKAGPDSGFENWYADCESAALDVGYSVHYRGSTESTTSPIRNALLTGRE